MIGPRANALRDIIIFSSFSPPPRPSSVLLLLPPPLFISLFVVIIVIIVIVVVVIIIIIIIIFFFFFFFFFFLFFNKPLRCVPIRILKETYNRTPRHGLSLSTGSLAEGDVEFTFNLLYKPFKYLINNYLWSTVLVGTKYKEPIQSSEILLGLFDSVGEGSRTTILRNIENYTPMTQSNIAEEFNLHQHSEITQLSSISTLNIEFFNTDLRLQNATLLNRRESVTLFSYSLTPRQKFYTVLYMSHPFITYIWRQKIMLIAQNTLLLQNT